MTFLEYAASWLTPPGEGVYTIHAAKEKRIKLQRSLYGDSEVRSAWLQSLQQLASEKVALLGIPSDCGGGIQRGANWGPLYLREALIADGETFPDLGDVRVIPHLLHDKYLNQNTLAACREALYGKRDLDWPVSPLSLTEAVQTLVQQTYPKLHVLGIGGDHSVSYPLVRGWASARRERKLALLHFDAHTDLLDQRLGVDLCFGTWAYHVREFFPDPDQLIQIGIRSTGKERGHWEGLGLTQHWAQDIHEHGYDWLANTILQQLRRAKVDEVYISFDVDALDSRWVSSTGTPEAQGLEPAACGEVIRKVAQSFNVTGADVVELAPLVNHQFFPNNSQVTSLMSAVSIARTLLTVMAKHA